MDWQPHGSSASFPRRWEVNGCGGLIVSHTLTMFTRREWVTYPPPPWVTPRPFQLFQVLLLVLVLGYVF